MLSNSEGNKAEGDEGRLSTGAADRFRDVEELVTVSAGPRVGEDGKLTVAVESGN